MSKCRYNLERDCHDKDCVDCVLEDIKAEIIKCHAIGCDLNCKSCKMFACIEPKDVIIDLQIIDNHISGKEHE